ncbi:MAG: HD domain-containing protein [Spirochaetales bacterium]|jgi:dGTPase|nr:HD domain-containing protein [Spirochaetales bacterium]
MSFENKLPQEELLTRRYAREEDVRGHYFRDITALIHSYPFRRLKHKTQVFFAPKNDHICTRIEHVMHVATISATICRAFELNVDLAWAISLGHDFGHTPFGHAGEKILAEILKDEGGFNHELYSLYVADNLINYGKGLNLTYAVRDGILNHCGEEFEQAIKPDFTIRDLSLVKTLEFYPCTWEGAIMRMSDKLAYLGRDLEDAISLRLVTVDDLPKKVKTVLGVTNSQIIDTLVGDIIKTSEKTGTIGFSDDFYEASIILKDFNYSRIYENPKLSTYHAYFRRIMNTLFDYLIDIFERYGFDSPAYEDEGNGLGSRFGDYLDKMRKYYDEQGTGAKKIVADYVAGMTDDFALECVNEIMVPRRFGMQFEDSPY